MRLFLLGFFLYLFVLGFFLYLFWLVFFFFNLIVVVLCLHCVLPFLLCNLLFDPVSNLYCGYLRIDCSFLSQNLMPLSLVANVFLLGLLLFKIDFIGVFLFFLLLRFLLGLVPQQIKQISLFERLLRRFKLHSFCSLKFLGGNVV
jgi:hypothetical protein